jgi:hypothetical protein
MLTTASKLLIPVPAKTSLGNGSMDTDSNNGRPGMDLWKVLVMGTIRLNCNWDYDKLQEMANNHKTLGQMLGHGMMDDDDIYPLQTLKNNVGHRP